MRGLQIELAEFRVQAQISKFYHRNLGEIYDTQLNSNELLFKFNFQILVYIFL